MAYRYDHPDNLVSLIEDSVKKFSGNPLFGTKNPAGDYEWVTYGQVGRRIDDLRGGLAHMGIKKRRRGGHHRRQPHRMGHLCLRGLWPGCQVYPHV
jgi:long-subunit acyl-CoA synthetase (AMP-forming)